MLPLFPLPFVLRDESCSLSDLPVIWVAYYTLREVSLPPSFLLFPPPSLEAECCMGIEWVRIYNSKPEVKMALGKKEFIVYERIRKSDACGGAAEWWQQAKPLKKEESVKASDSVAWRRYCGMSVVSCGWKNMENGWKNLWKSGSRWGELYVREEWKK